MTRRRILVGDVQGCREELEDLLETLNYDPAADELHPAGDLVNRGPDSVGVLRLLRQLDAGGVLGNHDTHALALASGRRKPSRRDTAQAVTHEDDGEELLAWLAARPFCRAWDDVLLVHAGVSPVWADPVAHLAGRDPWNPDREVDFAVLVRFCDADGRRPETDWPEPGKPFVPWFRHWQLRPGERRTAVFGHWARLGRVEESRVRGLDTGCVYGGELTAYLPDEDRLVSVPARRAWCPTTDR